MTRWQPTKPPSGSSATHHRAQPSACRRGEHSMTPTFRPGETLCLGCGLVLYCPLCLTEQHLPTPPNRRAFAVRCAVHQSQNAEVMA